MRKSLAVFLVGIMVFGLATYAIGQTTSKGSSASTQKKTILWHKYDEALELAKKENKHVLVFFTTNWCGYCKKMKEYTFTDPRVFALMSEEFILAKVDGNSKNKVKVIDKDSNVVELTERELSQAYRVRGYPTTVFLKPDGSRIAPISGYVKAN